MIIPTAANDSKMTTAKRQTLADFLYYSVCEGQKEMGPIGYSPLPVNLVQASFAQINMLKTADPKVDLTKRSVTTCHNPTFVAGQPTRNYLAEIAPNPPTCDKAGQGPCTGNGDTGTQNPGTSGGNGSGGNGSGGNGSGTKGSGGKGGTAATGKPGATASPTASGAVDPVTGQAIATSGGNASVSNPLTVAADLPVTRSDTMAGILAPLAVVLLLLSLVVPPVLGRRFAKPKSRQ